MSKPNPVKNRRIFSRRKRKGNVKLTCQVGSDLGPNLGLSLTDVGQDGCRIQVKAALEKGTQVIIGLEGLFHSRPLKLMGTVTWCGPADDGSFVVGVRWEKRLSYEELTKMT